MLKQFDVAYLEQALLCFLQVKFEVQNSSEAWTESTGPLPMLRQGHVLIGREQQRLSISTKKKSVTHLHEDEGGGGIAAYLSSAFRSLDEAASEATGSTNSCEFLPYKIIIAQCEKIAYSRFRFDDEGGTALMKRYRLATREHQRNTNNFISSELYARFAYFCQKVAAIWEGKTKEDGMFGVTSNIEIGSSNDSNDEFLQRINKLYTCLNNKMTATSSSACESTVGRCWFFGGREPTVIDAILFDHVAKALSTPKLCECVASYSNLMKHYTLVMDMILKGDGANANRKNAFFQAQEVSQ